MRLSERRCAPSGGEDWTIRAYRERSEAVAGKIREIMIVSTEPSEGRSVELMTHTKKSATNASGVCL
jgi:hypothetical protein